MAGLNAELAAPNNGIPGSDATTNPEAGPYHYNNQGHAHSLPNQLPPMPVYHVAQFNNGLPPFPPYNQRFPQFPRTQYAPRPIAVTHDDVDNTKDPTACRQAANYHKLFADKVLPKGFGLEFLPRLAHDGSA